ncbi:hypothetical protein IAE22_30240, partial [Bacillus sp. S34]|nr:hypothetical protein [Bacillus sp. S34]
MKRISAVMGITVAVAASALLLAGCSSTSSSNDSAGSGSTAASDGAWSYKDATGATVKVDH